jgi:hypothetical protein
MSSLDGDLVRSGGVRRCARPDGCSRTLSADGQRFIELRRERGGGLGIEHRHRGDVRLLLYFYEASSLIAWVRQNYAVALGDTEGAVNWSRSCSCSQVSMMSW